MRRGPVVLTALGAFAALSVCAAFASSAIAARVIVLSPGGRAAVRDDPFVPEADVTPTPAIAGARSARRLSSPTDVAARANPKRKRQRRPPPPSVHSDLANFKRAGTITRSAFRGYSLTLNQAIASKNRLRGTRHDELEAVLVNMHDLAVRHQLTPSRLPALFETLASNRKWWTTGPLLESGQLVEFTGSQLVWEYYSGQGIELQALASFGKADGLYTDGSGHYPQLRQLLSELIPLAVNRGGGLTWEYYFNFDGGRPPWTSAMSQGTALEALTRAYQAFHDSYYLSVAHRALPAFTVAPPVGVRVPTRRGARYLQYSFAPGTSIINAFLQSLIGLYDYAQVSGDAEAARLFAAGNAEAKAEVPSFDTGAWSLYQPGIEDSLSYHELVTGFLKQLCSRTAASVYCTAAEHFAADLKTPPAVAQLTGRAPVAREFSIAFRLSKISHVGIVVLNGSRILFETSAYFPYGVHTFSIPPLARKGEYTIHLAATDLAENFNRIVGTLSVR